MKINECHLSSRQNSLFELSPTPHDPRKGRVCMYYVLVGSWRWMTIYVAVRVGRRKLPRGLRNLSSRIDARPLQACPHLSGPHAYCPTRHSAPSKISHQRRCRIEWNGRTGRRRRRGMTRPSNADANGGRTRARRTQVAQVARPGEETNGVVGRARGPTRSRTSRARARA